MSRREPWVRRLAAALSRDARYAARQLRRAPGFTASLLLVLAGAVAMGVTALAVVQGGRGHHAPLQSPTGMPLPVAETTLREAPPPPPATGRAMPHDGGPPPTGDFPLSIARVQRQGLRTLLGTVTGVAGLALGLACCGLALLLLSRAAARRAEVAMRAVLGAAPRRVLGQLLVEGVLVALLGSVLGGALAGGALALLRRGWPTDLAPWLHSLAPGSIVVGAGAPLLAVLVFMLSPALAALRGSLHPRIAGAGRSTAGPREGLLRTSLTVATIGSSFALLAAAGLLLRGFGAGVAPGGPGFDARDTLTLQVTVAEADPARRAAAYERMLHWLRATPGSQAASLATPGTWLGLGTTDLVHTLTGSPVRPGILRPARYHAVSPGYFRALGIPVVRGREFTRADRGGGVAVAVVNEAFANRLLPRVDPIGRQLQLGGVSLHGTFYTVVGVVRDPQSRGIGTPAEPVPALYLSILQAPPPAVGLAVRAADPSELEPAVRRAVHAAAPGARVSDPSTMEERLARFRAPLRWFGSLLAALAAATTLLAASSLYGVIAYNVGRRRREIGIRMALGARAASVVRMVVGRGLVLTLRGVVLGAAGALCLGRLLQFYFHGVRLGDPLPYLAVAVLVTAVALLASFVPARQAARVDPVIALRSE